MVGEKTEVGHIHGPTSLYEVAVHLLNTTKSHSSPSRVCPGPSPPPALHPQRPTIINFVESFIELSWDRLISFQGQLA